MRARSGWIVAGLTLALVTGCGTEATEEYPEAEEVPVTAPPPGATTTGVDTLLDPVTSPPPPGATPP